MDENSVDPNQLAAIEAIRTLEISGIYLLKSLCTQYWNYWLKYRDCWIYNGFFF